MLVFNTQCQRSKKLYYLVWWKGYKKSDATWELEKNLLQDDAGEYIDEYKKEANKKKRKK